MEASKAGNLQKEALHKGQSLVPYWPNIYLDPLDWEMARAGLEMVRYADDFSAKARAAAPAAPARGKKRASHNAPNCHAKQDFEHAGGYGQPFSEAVVEALVPSAC